MNNYTPTNWITWTKWINSQKFTYKVNQEESENLNRQITSNEIEAVIKNSHQTIALGQRASQVNCTKHSKKNTSPSQTISKNSTGGKDPKLILQGQHYPNSKIR